MWGILLWVMRSSSDRPCDCPSGRGRVWPSVCRLFHVNLCERSHSWLLIFRMCIISSQFKSKQNWSSNRTSLNSLWLPFFSRNWNANLKSRNGNNKYASACVLTRACETTVFLYLWRRCTQTRIFQNLVIRIWWNLVEFLLLTQFK